MARGIESQRQRQHQKMYANEMKKKNNNNNNNKCRETQSEYRIQNIGSDKSEKNQQTTIIKSANNKNKSKYKPQMNREVKAHRTH